MVKARKADKEAEGKGKGNDKAPAGKGVTKKSELLGCG